MDDAATLRVGFIGQPEAIAQAREWIETKAAGVHGDENHPEFPGCMGDRGLMLRLLFDESWNASLYRKELDEVNSPRLRRERFQLVLDLLDSKLQLLAERDQPPEYVVLALTKDNYDSFRAIDFNDREYGAVHRDFRRAFKAVAMKHRLPTQILKHQTARDETGDNVSKIAWNFFTGLYFKSGRNPWGPVGLQPGTCYIGISFYRPLGTKQSTVRTSLIQAFDEHGDGLVLRGHEFHWDADKEKTNSPHLTEEQAASLVELVLSRYQREMRQNPRRVVVHKTSQFWEDELAGFKAALNQRVEIYDLLALKPQSTVRLLPASTYPTLRGTWFSVQDLDFLYTSGFLPELGQFHGTHVPAALQISDHIGSDTPRERLLRETLVLTKMNWNSSRLGGLMPITIRFARLVGDVMREIPPDREPLTNFKFYM